MMIVCVCFDVCVIVWLLAVRCDGLNMIDDAVLACGCVVVFVFLIVRAVCFALCCGCVVWVLVPRSCSF